MNIDVIKTGPQSIVIKLDEESCPLIVNTDGSIDRLTARCIAAKAMTISAVEYSALSFILEAFLGNGGCLLFASGRRETANEVFSFAHVNEVALCAKSLPDDLEASLYFFDGNFYLSVKNCSDHLQLTLEEYGKHVENGGQFLASIHGCYKTILTENTIIQLRSMA